jgi:ketosteroid isomerase-like protein
MRGFFGGLRMTEQGGQYQGILRRAQNGWTGGREKGKFHTIGSSRGFPLQNRRGDTMKKWAWTVLLVCACAGLGMGPTRMAAAQNPSVEQHLKQLETDWLKAEKAGDVARLNEIIADDWQDIYVDGSRGTKQTLMEGVKSGKYKMESFEMGPMNVKMLGNVAVVQGSDTEKSTSDGKDSSGKYVWTDVYVKRGGKWVAVRSQIAKVK